MTVHRTYISSGGPWLHDDTILVNDYEGEFSGVYQHSLITTGNAWMEGTPVEDYEVTRLVDLLESVFELFTATGTITARTQTALANGTFDLFLPTIATGIRRTYNVKNIGTGVITLKPNVVDTDNLIEGETYQPLRAGDCATITLYSDEWLVI